MTEHIPTPEEVLLVGEIVAAFGIRGQLKVRSLTDHVAHLRRKIKTVYVGPKLKPYQIKEVFEHKPGLLVFSFEGIATRTDAEGLRGSEMFILESQAVPLAEDEYFIHDLYGMQVLIEGGELLGTVREVLQTGANDVLVVQREQQPEALIPIIHDVIVEMDTAQKRLVIRLIPGLLGE